MLDGTEVTVNSLVSNRFSAIMLSHVFFGCVAEKPDTASLHVDLHDDRKAYLDCVSSELMSRSTFIC